MSECNGIPTLQTIKDAGTNAEVFNEVVTSNAMETTKVDSIGNKHKTLAHLDSLVDIAGPAADRAEQAANAALVVTNYKGPFIPSVTSAVRGKSYFYNSSMWACLNDTSDTPSESNVNWYSLNNHSSMTNRGDTGAHSASAIDLEDGRSLKQYLDELPGNIATSINQHNRDAAAHPELSAFILSQADRAENAANNALSLTTSFPSVEEGLLNTEEGDQFTVVEVNEVLRYKKESGSATFLFSSPTTKLVTESLQSMQENNTLTEFHIDEEQINDAPLMVLSEEDEKVLTFLRDGSLDFKPSVSVKTEILSDVELSELNTHTEFHTGEPLLPKGFSIVDGNGNSILTLLSDGSLEQPWLSDFFSEEKPEDRYVKYHWLGEDGRVFFSLYNTGASAVGGTGSGGLDVQGLKFREVETVTGEAYNAQGYVKVNNGTSIFNIDPFSVFSNTSNIYNKYDQLVDEHPDYVSMRVAGVDLLGNEIREYTFKPAGYILSSLGEPATPTSRKNKIVLFCTVHGNEKRAAAGVYYMMDGLCRRWKKDYRLGRLRWDTEFVVVPVSNPSGVNANTRNNHRNVDLNRNFTFEWDLSTSPVKGEAPMSEAETQIIIDIINSHPDADVIVDNHNAGSLNAPSDSDRHAYWVGTRHPNLYGTLRKGLSHMQAYLRREWDGFGADDAEVVKFTGTGAGTLACEVVEVLGRQGMLLETGSGWADISDLEKHTQEAVISLNVLLSDHINNERYLKEAGVL